MNETTSTIIEGTAADLLGKIGDSTGAAATDNASDTDFIPAEAAPTVNKAKVVILKPIHTKGFRLGLEATAEHFIAMPGTTQRWAPKRVGGMHRTGLDRTEFAPTPEERAARKAELEIEIGEKLDYNFYAFLSFKIDNNKPHGEKLYLDRPIHLLVYLAMLESDDVANGYHEYKSGKKPLAQWYIEDKEAEAEQDTKDFDDKLEAGQKYKEISSVKRRKIGIIVGLAVQGLSDKAADITLGKWIDSKLANARLFLSIVDRGDTYISVYELVKQGIKLNIIRKTGTSDYFYGDTMIGTTEEQIVSKMMSTQYSDLRIGIQSKVEAKLNAR